MRQYHKIQTVFKRDPITNHKTLLIGEYSLPEFEYLQHNQWVFTEKVDGTNIRVMWNHETGTVVFGGKTDNAQIPSNLVNALAKMFPARKFKDHEVFNGASVCLYGEGYGAKIQKGGGNYRPDQSFVLFDVLVGEWWLQRKDVESVSKTIGVEIVPIIWNGPLTKMIDMARHGFDSQWGKFPAEGIVARPLTELRARDGSRIITKIKHKDFG